MKQTKKQRNWKKILLITLSTIVALIAAAGIGLSLFIGQQVAHGLLYMNAGNDTKGNSIRQLEAWGYDLESFQTTYIGEDFTLEASDGVTVPVTYYPAVTESSQRGTELPEQPEQPDNAEESKKPVVILVHGAGGDRVSVAPLAELYLEQGYQVLTYDQRGHGDNSDDKVSFGYFEARDVACLVDYAAEVLGADQIIVHGQSMGGATTALYAATEHAREHVDSVILDAPVDSMEHMFRGVWAEMEGSEDIPTDYVVACGDLYLRLFYGFSFDDANTIARMKDNQVKTLVILCEKDNICLPESMEQLYNNIDTDNKALMRVESEHIEGAIDDPEGYIHGVLDFIQN
ncbi:MAG: alpha/beta fold hydrolase [Lachnospiraceae bacterium]|nr:alpha/beta fold hydrolase [Lachnospiraceae bacterium]